MRTVLTVLFGSLAAPAAGDFAMQLPVDCILGETCYIQQYMDRDPSDGFADYRGFGLSYDGHKGTDFAMPTVSAAQGGVAVLAASSGTVLGVRDGMADVWDGAFDSEAVKGRDCGNGLVIDHGDGWHTQYCHLRNGSVSVSKGQKVEAGTRLGEIGMSGRTQFPHLHLSVRKDGKPIDPFDPAPTRDGDSLWSETPAYQPGGILLTDFATRVPDYAMIKIGSAEEELTGIAPAIVGYSYAFGGRTGDVLRMTLTGPAGFLISDDYKLPRNRAQFFRAIGKKRRKAHWPEGEYRLKSVMLRQGMPMSQMESTFSIAR